MKIEIAIEVLENHNKWRKDNNVPSLYKQIHPRRLGIAIDTVVKEFKNK